ncbi:MAG: oxidoreductase [Burkholderiales bacterium RIFCSPHIGHO2_12_FULL_69_20]|nr:MAG: oxidoreductase [Burkholderiales bacterium RIFCSPHIGHO2_12_FULL_69_20]
METNVCVVTGSSSGIGAATARLYAERGWNVVVNFSREAAPAEAVAAECRALGEKFGADVLVQRCNVADDADCRALAAAVQARWGRCDVLVNNAGTTKFVHARHLDGLDAQDFQNIYAVNVVGAFQMTRALEPMLKLSPSGAVVNVSSIAASTGMGSSIAYAASKGALNTLTMALARALGPAIRVNAIAPGLVETPWLQNGMGAERYAASVAGYKARAALAEIIQPEDVARAAWYLGVDATKTSGEVLAVDAAIKLMPV